jgi:hypothetical protein
MAKKKTVAKMGVKEASKKATKNKNYLTNFAVDEPHYSTRELAVKNSRKLRVDEKIFGVSRGTLTKTQEKAAKIMQDRREGERTRTASRAKGIAKRQAKVAKARRAKKALGN